ncbi:sushi, von Willebrand factor type A, EGF and pentraxin domain-containing protein 1-like isoform X3 [Biomphalaria glabrata]|uniref:Sushi, von Willebrand factor type A, EGF and pentraxin domain-containing protein 1-like isoform X3 n=1 Tax=Biomphalaria glabrata TaxID=6526 RepID=A0A9W2YT94_BIOGL|nr:sushi, von Willebrand factor type A, EGF and pentraxin domain-containing protein 1-like isoform X3 [Biomphalaria glabrata]
MRKLMFLISIIWIMLQNEEWCINQVSAAGCGLGKEFRYSKCLNCYENYYKDTEGNTDCIKCPRHKETSITGATSVSDCNVDYCDIGAEYVDQTCSDCQVGFYKETQGKSSCAKCPAHYITLATGATSGDDCNILYCGPGYEKKDDKCSECDFGSYKIDKGNSPCKKCPEHKKTPGKGSQSMSSCSLTFCEPGFYSPDTIVCSICPNGTYKGEAGNMPCTPCPGNTTTPSFGSTNIAQCSLIHCEKGLFLRDNISCSVCLNGTYKDFTGNQQCIKCPMNTTTREVGGTDIKDCSLECPKICIPNDPCKYTGTSSCVCPSGYYGQECSKRCSPGCLDDSCHRINGTCQCKEGYYGDKCLKTGILDKNNKWSSHCKSNCSEEKRFTSDQCSMGWFGEFCQYKDLGVDAIMDNTVLNDNNDSTCVKQNNVTVHWQKELQAITWIRLVLTSNDDISEITIQFNDEEISGPSLFCDPSDFKYRKYGNTSIDFHCEYSYFHDLVHISWQSDSSICSVYISGERNMATTARKVRWKNIGKRWTPIETLNDGYYGSDGCLIMNSSIVLEFNFWNDIFSSQIIMFTDFPREDGHGTFSVLLMGAREDLVFNISTSRKDVFVQKAIFEAAYSFRSVNIRVLSGTLHLCEVEIYGGLADRAAFFVLTKAASFLLLSARLREAILRAHLSTYMLLDMSKSGLYL